MVYAFSWLSPRSFFFYLYRPFTLQILVEEVTSPHLMDEMEHIEKEVQNQNSCLAYI